MSNCIIIYNSQKTINKKPTVTQDVTHSSSEKYERVKCIPFPKQRFGRHSKIVISFDSAFIKIFCQNYTLNLP